MHISQITTSPEAQEAPRLSKPYKLPNPAAALAEIIGADEAAKLIADHKAHGSAGLAARRPCSRGPRSFSVEG